MLTLCRTGRTGRRLNDEGRRAQGQFLVDFKITNASTHFTIEEHSSTEEISESTFTLNNT
jgi:hypothetical protein